MPETGTLHDAFLDELREAERGDELRVMPFNRSRPVRMKSDCNRATDPTTSETTPSTGEISKQP